MASCHLFCLALLFALSLSSFDMAFGARSLPTTTTTTKSEDQAALFLLPKFKIPSKSPKFKLLPPLFPKPPKTENSIEQSEFILPKFKLTPKKPIILPKFKLPKPPKTTSSYEQSLPLKPGFFKFPPFFKSPSLPFPDLPLVPALPFNPPSKASQTSSTATTKAAQLP